MVKPAKKREMVRYMIQEYGLDIKQACRSIDLERSSYYYQSKVKDDSELLNHLNTLAEQHPRYGFKKMYHTLRSQGKNWNHKKVYRVYKELGLHLTRKKKRRLPVRERQKISLPSAVNQVWSMDFMSDALSNGRRFRTLNILDDYNREVLWIEIGLSIGAQHMIDLLQWIIKERGKPRAIRVDNGTEFTSSIFMSFCDKHNIEIRYIQPGKPVQNALIERFNRTYRTEILDCRIFENLIQVKEVTLQWIAHYNLNRPHESLFNLSPIAFLFKKKDYAFSDDRSSIFSNRILIL